ncbi:MAG: sigma-70 family RNA polymerase sigma factor [Alphaproteobacteria bacterium]|nr:MAG: sigma-70 family RNA polymerase sigma factor [Alphaproteobacteria bacterium]
MKEWNPPGPGNAGSRLGNSRFDGKPFADNRRVTGKGSAEGRSQTFWRHWIDGQHSLSQLALRWMSGNKADAEDLLSRAAIKAHDRYLRDAPKIRNVQSWLARVLHNMCMDEHRRRSVRRRVVEGLQPEQASNVAFTGGIVENPEERLALAGSMDTAVDVIMKMPKRLRHPFVLRFIYQYSNQEIARHLDLTEVNVRKRIQLGRMMMRDHLDPL